MPEKIRDSAELVFIQTVASGTVHIEVRYASYDDPHRTDERVSFAEGMHSVLYGAHIVLCGVKTYPVAEKTHYYTDCFPDEKLCQQCHRRLHPDDIERAFRHAQPDDPQGSDERAVQMRNRAVDGLVAEGTIVSRPVEAAMREIPRELFAPDADLEQVYHRYNGTVTKRDASGTAVSSVSAPQVQAHMLETAAISPGMRILEVGSGGYNAALLAELVGPKGQVTTVDIDPDVTESAIRVLEQTGYSRVNVVLADAHGGVPEYAPYDRILVTVGAWDIPPAWTDQLVDGGRLLVPLQLRGLSRVIAFEKVDDHLVSYSSRAFGFVSMQGAGAHEAMVLVMRDGEVTLRFGEKADVDLPKLQHLFDTSRTEVWSGVRIGRTEPWDTVHMWLATALPGFCRVVIDKASSTGLISPPGNHTAASAVVDGDSFAYVTTRGTADSAEVEFGAHAFGPHAGELAGHVAAQLRVWAREYRGGPGAKFYVHPAGTPDDLLPPGRVIDKIHCRITICSEHREGRPHYEDHRRPGRRVGHA